jgi:hypothetical protein
MWNMKCFVIPLVTRATGIVSKGLKISGKYTRTTFSTFFKNSRRTRKSHIIRKVLQSDT